MKPEDIKLPFTDAQNQRRDQLESQYGGTKLRVNIDSIEPEGGPTSGETRVTVRGGPFKDMELVYPKPKCKFGRNDRIVAATYVSCSESPISQLDLEGRHKNRVSKNTKTTPYLFISNHLIADSYYSKLLVSLVKTVPMLTHQRSSPSPCP